MMPILANLGTRAGEVCSDFRKGRLMKRMSVALLFLCFMPSAWAQPTSASIRIEHAWARATPRSARTGAVYMTIANSGAADDRIIAAASPVAAKVELHREFEDKGIMKMRPLASLDVKAKGVTMLAPGGVHLMLTGLKHPLDEGQSFPLSVTFEKAGRIDTMVVIEKAGAMGETPGMNKPGMKM